MALSKSQKKLAAQIIGTGKKRGESRKEIVSAIATALVEANLSNHSGGSGTSAGWRQEIDAYGSVKKRTNVKGAANRYYDETSALDDGKGMSVGDLSQAVQRSAYPDRYGEVAGQAREIVNSLSGKGMPLGGAGSRSKVTQRAQTQTTLVPPSKAVKQAAIQAQLEFINTDDKELDDYLAVASATASLEPKEVTRQVKHAAVEKSLEKRHNGSGAGGGRSGVAPGRPDIVQIGKMAQEYGLNVGENPKFGGVSAVHSENSFHYTGDAIDVSGDPKKLAKFANKVAKKYGPKLAELFWNGPNSVNYDEGKPVQRGYVSGHDTHVHVAVPR
jgi:hypothetical protein